MSTDRELLALAAKAVGFQNYTVSGNFLFVETGSCRGASGYYWSPLTDDGDALRLAVKLKMSVSVFDDAVGIGINPDFGYREYVISPDPGSATRRAIVLAAAEIGKDKP